jgi:hypothetical protein
MVVRAPAPASAPASTTAMAALGLAAIAVGGLAYTLYWLRQRKNESVPTEIKTRILGPWSPDNAPTATFQVARVGSLVTLSLTSRVDMTLPSAAENVQAEEPLPPALMPLSTDDRATRFPIMVTNGGKNATGRLMIQPDGRLVFFGGYEGVSGGEWQRGAATLFKTSWTWLAAPSNY